MMARSNSINGKRVHASKKRSRRYAQRIKRKGEKLVIEEATVTHNDILQEQEKNNVHSESVQDNLNTLQEGTLQDSSVTNNEHCCTTNSLNLTFMFLVPLLWLIWFAYAIFLRGKIFITKQTACRERNFKQRLQFWKVTQRKIRKNFQKKVAKHKAIKKNRRTIKRKEVYKTDEADLKTLQNFIDGKIKGRRIVDINYLWKQLRLNLVNHGKSCTIKDWILEKEASIVGGMRSLFLFKCRKCKKECRIWSEPNDPDIMNINKSSVLGMLHEGLGYSNVQGFFACMNIPYLSERTFKKNQEELLLEMQQLSASSVKKAGEEEEARLAKEAGDVDKNGLPYITVVVDGSWIKRSFGTKYDSLSGLGAIIGQNTGKVLYVGVKNKYCTMCERAERWNKKPAKHICCNKPSTLMETEALIDGFKESLAMHNIVYKFFIGDGDSNFHKRLLDMNPYAHLNIVPRKIECTNHLLRNFCKKTTTVAKTTQQKGTRKKGFVFLRNIVKNNILKRRQAVVDEVNRQLTASNNTWTEKIHDLQKHLINIPSHIFGEHKRCKELKLFCFNSTDQEKNFVPYLKAFGLYQRIEEHMKTLSCHSESLLHKVTNNVVEEFNSIVCKVVGGKRINFACSNQYDTRVALAVLQHNSNEDDHFWKEEMEPRLSKFYDNCLLPEILDSRYLRSMTIRDPVYIQEAKVIQEEKKMKSQKTDAKKAKQAVAVTEILNEIDYSIHKDLTKDSEQLTNRQLKGNRNNYEDQENDEPEILSWNNDESLWTVREIMHFRKYYDTRDIPVNGIFKKNILDTSKMINDDSLDAFINVVKNFTHFDLHSVLYINSPVCVEPAKTKESAAIIGGNDTMHWRLAYYDGQCVKVFESIPGYTGGKLTNKELVYVLKRFPNITEKSVHFVKIKTKQPDGRSCGVYAAAFLTYLILTGEPSNVIFSSDVKDMRKHFLQIILSRKFTNFPTIE